MINDSERREITARLRELADANEGYLGMGRVNRVLRDGKAILGTSGLASVADVLRRYADLIDLPTARIDVNKHGRAYCTNCGCDDWCLADGSHFCPNCGAKVVDE